MLKKVIFIVSTFKKINNGIMQGNIIHRVCNLANSPSNYATPLKIAQYAGQLSKKGNLKVNVLNKKQLQQKNVKVYYLYLMVVLMNQDLYFLKNME